MLDRRRIPAVAALCLALLAGCGESADESLRERFGVEIPTGTRVVQHHCSGFGVDHADAWILSPASDALVERLVSGGRLVPQRDGDGYSGGLISEAWPAWWPAASLDELTKIYHGGESPSGREYRRVWVDPKSNQVYVQYFTT